jgi:subtilisin family serine protease
MPKYFVRFVLALIAVVASGWAVSAQRPLTLPVVVVFHENTPFAAYTAAYHADERAQGNPDGWGYLNRGVAGLTQSLEQRHGFRANHVFSAALQGFSATLTARQIADLESDPAVEFVELDGQMNIVAQALPWGVQKVGADVSSVAAGNGTGAVSNVHAYIIDTGIDTSHADLNVVQHVNFAGGQNKDCNGHGTHVSGTVAARDNAQDVVGVAPGAPLHGVKVLGCAGTGSTSDVIKGIDWVTANAIHPAVANMSLGGTTSTAIDNAVRNSATSGVFYAVAAGNSGADACNSSPARVGAGTNNGVMTVAATDVNDAEASWSNYGSCVDIWGPGVNILSTKRGGGTTTMSGTSMASPHGAGSAAVFLSTNPNAEPADVEAALKAAAQMTGTQSKDLRAILRLYIGGY